MVKGVAVSQLATYSNAKHLWGKTKQQKAVVQRRSLNGVNANVKVCHMCNALEFRAL